MACISGAKRVWRADSEFKGKADAELVQEEINQLAAQDPNGKCTNEALVDFARNELNSESRKCFEWDDTAAAEKFRLHQAARIKCGIITIAVKQAAVNGKATAAPVTIQTVTNHALSTPGQGHKDIELVLQSQADMSALDKDMVRSIRSFAENFTRRYNLAPSYSQVEPIITSMLSSLSCLNIP